MRQIIQTVCGFLVFVAIAFSWCFALSFWNRLTLLRDHDQYKPETFVVTGAVFDPGGFENTSSTYWLNGIVAGSLERFIPNPHGLPAPRDADELERRYPKGTKINVLYNSAAERTIVQDETLRVKEATPDFWDREASRRLTLGILVFFPVPLTLCVYLLVRYINRRHDPNSVRPIISLRTRPRRCDSDCQRPAGETERGGGMPTG
jgi:hypothetical protein